METIEIPFKKEYKFLSKALSEAGYDNIPSNVIIDKTLTGIGATHMEIKAKRNSIIIEPNVPVILGKTKEHAGTLAVYKACSKQKIKSYFLKDDITFKKFITTPEGFAKIRTIAQELKIDIYRNYFCLFDECEKISQDVDYRENITQPINDFFDFVDKAFVSATPLQIKHAELEPQGFKRLKIVPDYDYKENIELIVTSYFNRKIVEKLTALSLSKCICIFFNSVTGIKKIIELLNLQSYEYTVFCSANSQEKLKTHGYISEEDFDISAIRKYNFFTSRFFSAVDIKLDQCPDVVILTDLTTAHYSMIDPYSEAIQIQGRFRKTFQNGKRYKSLCHITNQMNLNPQSEQEVLEEFNQWKETYIFLKAKYDNTTSINQRKAIEKEFIKSCLYPYLTISNLKVKSEVNFFSVINKYNQERVKHYYTGAEALEIAYNATGHFNVDFIDDIDRTFSFDFPTDLFVRLTDDTTSEKERIYNIIQNIQTEGITKEMILKPMQKSDHAALYTFTSTIIEAYEQYDAEYVLNKSYKQIVKILNTNKKFAYSQEKRFSFQLIQEIISEFNPDLNKPIPINSIRDRLQYIYNLHGIINKKGEPFRVIQTTIKDYYNPTVNNDKRTYQLKNVLPNILEISENNQELNLTDNF